MKKKPKTGQKSPEVVVDVTNPDNHKHILCCLIDSGSSDSIVLDKFIISLKNNKTQQNNSGPLKVEFLEQLRAARSLFI
jgi:hypothetical protein